MEDHTFVPRSSSHGLQCTKCLCYGLAPHYQPEFTSAKKTGPQTGQAMKNVPGVIPQHTWTLNQLNSLNHDIHSSQKFMKEESGGEDIKMHCMVHILFF